MNRKRHKEDTSIDLWEKVSDYPNLSVPQHIIIRAVQSLPMIEALALIRGAYNLEGAWASLNEAKLIYACIMDKI